MTDKEKAPAYAAAMAAGMRDACIDAVLTVPCSWFQQWLADHVDVPGGWPTYYVTREEEGVGLASGLSLAGRRPLLAIQNSGLGNSINAILSLPVLYNLPFIVLMSMRGLDGEPNPGQVPMGEASRRLVEEILGAPTSLVHDLVSARTAFTIAAEAASLAGRPSFILMPDPGRLP